MKRFKLNNQILLLLCLIFALSFFFGCADNDDTDNQGDTSNGASDVSEEPTVSSDVLTDADEFFTLRYDPNESLNPITGTDSDNMVVASLLYEGLFVLDQNFMAQPVLCESYTTVDGLVFTFSIKSDIAMTDGTALSANDVAYSLNRARESTRYASRLSDIVNVEVIDSLTLKITLSAINYNLPALLDIPVIQNGSIGERVPDGTGPYAYTNDDSAYLSAFSGYREYENLPIKTVKLESVSGSELPESFAEQMIDLLETDPTGSSPLNISLDYESHYYDTTIMQYIGFNVGSNVLADPVVRRAISYAVDREYIADTIMSGHALVSPLVISPAWGLYDETWEDSASFSLQTLSELLSDVGMEDTDENGYLEYPNGTGAYMGFHVDFIVNSDNEYKVSAAQKITDALKSVGLDVTLRKLSWDEYIGAIESGDFDMYYGEVMLTSDFDISVLLLADGSLNYGGVTDGTYDELISAYLSAGDDESTKSAAGELCAYVAEKSPIIPVLYKKYAVLTHRGIVEGMNPTQSDAFYGLTGWTINLG